MKYQHTIVTAAITVCLASGATQGKELSPQQWFEAGAQAVRQAKHVQPINHKAKNVILFIGDGMGISTITAARILEGQMRGATGEENQLFFETFPYTALSKVYSVDQQTPDSAPTMTAMVTGVKTKDGYLSVNHTVERGEPSAEVVEANSLETVLEQAEERGLSTGIVSTARITHATPAALYAHTTIRDWEADSLIDVPGATVPDIARQLIEFPVGDGIEVALGGGRSNFYPATEADPEYTDETGIRADGRKLYEEWTMNYGTNSAYVWNKSQFDTINPATTTHLLGLFEPSHVQYEADRASDTAGEPSLTEMTGKAIEILQQNQKGFFLMAEGGRIDHAHHAGNAKRALLDTIELAKAVKHAYQTTDPKDTLIIVTADHSHVFTIGGYPKRGNPILGKVVEVDETDFATDLLGLPYTTLSYANGPGYTGTSYADPERTELLQGAGVKTFEHLPEGYDAAVGRPDLTSVDTEALDFLQEATLPLNSETHSGEDVAIYASGPDAYLFHGALEQNVIYHVMADVYRFDR